MSGSTTDHKRRLQQEIADCRREIDQCDRSHVALQRRLVDIERRLMIVKAEESARIDRPRDAQPRPRPAIQVEDQLLPFAKLYYRFADTTLSASLTPFISMLVVKLDGLFREMNYDRERDMQTGNSVCLYVCKCPTQVLEVTEQFESRLKGLLAMLLTVVVLAIRPYRPDRQNAAMEPTKKLGNVTIMQIEIDEQGTYDIPDTAFNRRYIARLSNLANEKTTRIRSFVHSFTAPTHRQAAT